MIRLVVGLVILVIYLNLNITKLEPEPEPKTTLHICMRTKNSESYIEEMFDYYIYQGATSISIYDDSDTSAVFDLINNLNNPRIIYYKSAISKNENDDLIECYKKYYYKNDYIMNVDDDEFFYPANSNNCKNTIKSVLDGYGTRVRCLAIPVHFYGTNNIKHMADYTVPTFTKRDRDVTFTHYYKTRTRNINAGRETKPRQFYMYSSGSSESLKLRIQKAVFFVRNNNNSYLELIIKRYRRGSLIHGYGMNCNVPSSPKLIVAHYTRSQELLDRRTSTFWKNVFGLRRRFSTEDRIQKYLKERNRNEQEDLRISESYKCFKP